MALGDSKLHHAFVIRPTENTIYGTLGPSEISVTSSTVTFLDTEHTKR